MKITRRQFMTYVLTAAGASAGGALLISQLTDSQPDAPTTTPTPQPMPDTRGDLDDSTLATLMALVAAFVGEHGRTDHYAPFFRWRAQNLPDYKPTYELFAGGLDESAQALAGTTFAESDIETQRTILNDALALPDPDSSLFNPQPPPDVTPTPEDMLWLRFDRYVLGEIVHLFTLTNGWIMLGYENYPAQPRGLENYTQEVNA